MDSNLKKIVELILQTADSDDNGHPDRVSRVHSVLMSVNMLVGEEMMRIRNEERNRSNRENG